MISLGIGCRERAPEPAPVEPGTPRAFQFSASADLAFVYADARGVMQTARGVAAVPKISRRAVRVIEPTVEPRLTGDHELVHWVDLDAPISPGRYQTQLISRLDFERRALAALPPGLASRVSFPQSPAPLEPAPVVGHERIILYGTAWCGACAEARAFLRERQVSFEDRDVERDPRAAAELVRAAASAGVVADRVPIIDVRGRLLIGFDPVRIRTLIGEQI